jgi:phosphate transport system protein
VADARRSFHEHLDELRQETVRLGALAEEAIAVGTEVLLAANLTGAEGLVADDARLDTLTDSIEERALELMARQQPMASDLRTIVTTLRAIHEIERIGDLMVNVAKATRRLYPQPLDPKVRGILQQMGAQAREQLHVAIDAFADADVARAAALADMDDIMDEMQKALFRAIFATGGTEEANVQRAVQIALVGRYYERIADHAVNVAERVSFMVTGEPRRHEVATS